jgi:hypothetical protein
MGRRVGEKIGNVKFKEGKSEGRKNCINFYLIRDGHLARMGRRGTRIGYW